MEAKPNKLDELKGTNPFKVPEGYLEGLAGQIMNSLPEEPQGETRVISLYDRVRPWLYLAAVFVGLFFLLKIVVRVPDKDAPVNNSLYVQIHSGAMPEEDEEYLEYIENEFYKETFTQVMENIE
ncbi:MAG: hypothetical protein LBD27_06170 [Tannerella sp.]|jgi:hypothetical protein|nr:hypothetical protein [Tannerella sp.]